MTLKTRLRLYPYEVDGLFIKHALKERDWSWKQTLLFWKQKAMFLLHKAGSY